MEEKLLKAKELKDLLLNLKKVNGYIKVLPKDEVNTKLIVHITMSGIDTGAYSEVFHAYEDDPCKCTLSVLRNFFSITHIEDRLSL